MIFKKNFHYAWLVLASGTIALVGAIGFARFGYSTVLPGMMSDLKLNYSQAGLLTTLALCGYLVMALIGGSLVSKFGSRLIATFGLLISGSGMVLMGLSRNFAIIALFSAYAGLGSGAVHISIFGLWPAWFAKNKRGLAAGIAVSGGPIGMILSSFIVPRLTVMYGPKAWQTSWLVFGIFTLVVAVATYCIIRNYPAEKGLTSFGDNSTTAVHPAKVKDSWKSVFLRPMVWALGLVYGLFGFAYISYLTFYVKHMVTDVGLTNMEASNLYMFIGWISLVSGVVWGYVSDLIGRKRTLAILFSIQALYSLLFYLGNGPVYYMLSTFLFGLSALSIPAIIAATCGDIFGPERASTGLGFVTVFMGIGQVLGPFVSGILADTLGSFSVVYLLTAILGLAGAFISALIIKNIDHS